MRNWDVNPEPQPLLPHQAGVGGMPPSLVMMCKGLEIEVHTLKLQVREIQQWIWDLTDQLKKTDWFEGEEE